MLFLNDFIGFPYWLRIVGIRNIVYIGERIFHPFGDFFLRRILVALAPGDRPRDCCEVLTDSVNGAEGGDCLHIIHPQIFGNMKNGIKYAVKGCPVIVVCSGGVLKSVYCGECCVAYLYGIVFLFHDFLYL